MKINDLFFELSHEGRFNLLMLISEERKKHTHLEKELNMTGPEISRHLKRLQDGKLVKKTINGYYEITSFGKIITTAIPYFENSLKFVDFINSHNFAPIPPDLLFQISMLKDIDLKTATMENIELWTSLITKAQKYIYAITDQLQRSIIPLIQKKIQSGTALEIRAIIDQALFDKFRKPENLPSNAPQLLKQIDIIKNVRIYQELNVSTIITEQGALIFLKAGDSIDYSQGLFGKSPRFLQWTKTLFDLFWTHATAINPSDLV
ncbi:MAG: helix-turn-helix transcriptional regulator [Candidatus Helarchaeota archaeon]